MALGRKKQVDGGTTVTDRHPVDEMMKPGPLFVYGLRQAIPLWWAS